MKKNYLLFFSFLISLSAISQNVTVAGADATTNAGSPYATLKAAFDNINLASQTGNTIVIGIAGSTTEAASAVLNAGAWTSITISPTGGAARTISGAIVGHLIDLNGADNVTINGLNIGGNTLTISNTNTGSSSCIRFIADASTNTITNCTISGSTTSFGNIFFSTGTTTGNDANTISNNDIGAAGSNSPISCIYSLGTASPADNSGNIINNNNIFDFFSAGSVSVGVNINSGNTTWSITNNKLYQTTSRTYTTASTHNVINISSGDGHTISGNTIGYSASNGTGVYTMSGAVATRLIAINLAVGTTTATSVQSNTITAISLGTTSGATTTNGIICGINITAGNVNVGAIGIGNTIGASTGIDAIVGNSITANGLVVGVNVSSTGTVNIRYNTIGALSSGLGTISGNITGINISASATATTAITVSNNTVGNSTADNMRAGVLATTTGSSNAIGINVPGLPISGSIYTISDNTIQNISSFGTAAGIVGTVRGINSGSGTAGSVSITGNTIANLTTNTANTATFAGAAGISWACGSSSGITNNTIYNISNTNTGTNISFVAGISVVNAPGTNVTRNKIYGITNASTNTTISAPSPAIGIYLRGGTSAGLYINNNMVTLGTGVATNTVFIGIHAPLAVVTSMTSFIRYNTVRIEGSVSSGALPSFGFVRGDFSTTATTAAISILNSIFDNQRTGGSGKHYAIANNYGATTASATGWSATATNNNIYNSFSSSTIGYWDTDKDFNAWKTSVGGEGNSFSGFALSYQNTAISDLRLNMGTTPTPAESGASVVGSILIDQENDVRPGPTSVNGGGTSPDIGADEFDGVPLAFTSIGTGNWESGSTWNQSGAIPLAGNVATINNTHNVTVNASSANATRLTINAGGTLTINASRTITVAGSASTTITNNGTITSSGNITTTRNIDNNGTVTSTGALTLNGSTAQTVNLNSGNNISVATLTLNNSTGATLSGSGKLNVTGIATLTSGQLTTGGLLVLKSTLSGTARIPSIAGSISGNVTVERYIPGGRRTARFLGHPFSTALTMASLIDNIYVTGDGTTVGTGGPTTGAGFDATTTNRASSYWFDNGVAQAWTAFMTTSDASWTQYRGIRVLVRGDRTQTTTLTSATPPSPNAVTLDMTGTLNTGLQTITVPTGFSVFGNPYPSPVNLGARLFATTNIGTQFWYWDANAGPTAGAYRTRLIGALENSTLPMSGAFVVQPAAATSIAFVEADKVATDSTNLFRTTTQSGVIELQVLYNNYPADNMFVRFNNTANDNKDALDGEKLSNPEVNFYALSTDSKQLSLDTRPFADNKIIPLGFTATAANSFKIKVADYGITEDVYLKDKFLNALTKLDVTTEYSFSVDPSIAASVGENRFELMMKTNSALPATFLNVTAAQKNAGIEVSFTTANETNMSNYEVEESTDGSTFSKATSIAANNATTNVYNWFDANIINGDNYYRIKAVEKNGTAKYSNVVKVKIGGKGAVFSVYPNPVKGGVASLQMSNVEKGIYTVKIYNNVGQELAAKTINHNGGSATQTINLGKGIATGTYNMQITNGTTVITKTVIVE